MKQICQTFFMIGICFALSSPVASADDIDQTFRETANRTPLQSAQMVSNGRYLSTIGVCEACHTPPKVVDAAHRCEPDVQAAESQLKADPNWFAYLDNDKKMAGGVPFILRFGPNSSGYVSTSNLTPDEETGIGLWSERQIVDALRLGRRPDATALFLFPPHTFFKNLSDYDAYSIALYLKSLPPVRNTILPRQLPFPTVPNDEISPPLTSPEGTSIERAEYLTEAIVGCKECHSYTDADGRLHAYVGGDPIDPFNGTFRFGPDLPLRQDEKGIAAFPYPGFAVMYAGNLTKFGLAGPAADVPVDEIVKAIREGIGTEKGSDGRRTHLAHNMMWQFYRHMTDADAESLAFYLKSLRFMEHEVDNRLVYFGSDSTRLFERVFGDEPSENDIEIFNLDGTSDPCSDS